MLFSHGKSNSCGTAILINNKVNCTVLCTVPDPLGRFVISKVQVDDKVYSCFEKGCPTKPYATMPKGIMGNGGLWYLIEALGVSAT